MNLCKAFKGAKLTFLFRVSEMINLCLLAVLLACASDDAPELEKKLQKAPRLTFEKLTLDKNSVSASELLKQVKEKEKSGYRLKIIEVKDKTFAEIQGKAPDFRLLIKKEGQFELVITLEKEGYEDAKINAVVAFKRALQLVFTELVTAKKIITATDLLDQIKEREGYTLKDITLEDKTFGVVSGQKPDFVLTIQKIGRFKIKLVLEKKGGEDLDLEGMITITSEKDPAPTDLKFSKLILKYTGSAIDKDGILNQLQGTRTGYTLKSITKKSGATSILNIGGTAPDFSLRVEEIGIITLNIILEHPLKKDADLDFELEIQKGAAAVSIQFPEFSKAYLEGSNFTAKEIQNNLTGLQKSGYTLKEIKNLSNAICVINSDKKSLKFNKKIGRFTATLILEHPLKEDVTIQNAAFEITEGDAPVLTFPKLSKPFVSGGSFTSVAIEGNVLGPGTGYSLKEIQNIVPSDLAVVSGSALNFNNKIGSFSATVILENPLKRDVRIPNAEFEITRGAAPILTFTELSEPFRSGGSFTFGEIERNIKGATGYQLKDIQAISDSNLAFVSGKNLQFKDKTGRFSAKLIFEHSAG